MKNLIKRLLLTFLLVVISYTTRAQQNEYTDSTKVRLYKTEGGTLVGYITSQTPTTIYFTTIDGRNIEVPQHTVSNISTVKFLGLFGSYNRSTAFDNAKGEDFEHIHVFTVNGLANEPNHHSYGINIFGPTIRFSLKHNVNLNLATTWVAFPLGMQLNKSFKLTTNLRMSAGLYGFTTTYALFGGGLAPNTGLTWGTKNHNITLTGGYGVFWEELSAPMYRGLLSLSAHTKLTNKLSFVFDSFVILPETSTTRRSAFTIEDNNGNLESVFSTFIEDGYPAWGVVTPALRWKTSSNSAFQAGVFGLIYPDEPTYLAIPLLLQWFYAF